VIKTFFRLVVLALVLGGLMLAVHACRTGSKPGTKEQVELPVCAAGRFV
jgi:hypothetical protein